MSWAVEEWKDGLPGKALQKIQEIEGQLDKLKKERQQKQFQMDSLEAALQKQKQKMDSEKSEAAALKRENQSLVESCDGLEKTRQKVSHDLQVKEQQVNYLEGQLNSSRKQIERLEQEVKKYKNELDRSQTSHTADMQPYSTPQKSFTTPATPSYRQHDSKLEELQERYNQEVDERKRLEGENKVLQVKLLNQQSSVSHKDIARQQAGSSIFPWQQDQTHGRQSLQAMETPSKRRNGPSGMSWTFDDTPLRKSQHHAPASQSDPASSQQMEQLRTLNQDLKSKISELELRVQAQDKDMKNQINKFHETQSQLDKARKDLAEKDKLFNKSRDELTKVTGQHEQAIAKSSSFEQKLKQVTEEMNCQRHNAESARRSLEQRIKDQERESQKELAQLQNAHKALDQQFNQTKTKMNQEIQQAKKDCNVLQSEIEKVTSLKSRLEKELEELKQKLFRSEQGLQASQTKETELKRKFDEMQREKNALSSQLDQGVKRMSQLEEEKKSAEQNMRQSCTILEDLKAKSQAQSEEMTQLRTKLDSQNKSSATELEGAKKTISDLEEKNEMSQKEMKRQAVKMEQMNSKICALEKESEDLKCSQNEVVEVKRAFESLLAWKNEKEQIIMDTESERERMQSKINDLEKSAEKCNDEQNGLKDKLLGMEKERQNLSDQIDSIKGELLNKCMELEEKGKMFEELQQQHLEAEQKHSKDFENSAAQISVLQGQVQELESRLQQEQSKEERMEQYQKELIAQCEDACDLAKSKDSIIELNKDEIAHLQESAAQAEALHEQQLDKLKEEKSSLMTDCEERLSQKTEETEQAKTNLEKCQQDLLLLQDQIASLESALKLQKGLSVEIQAKYDDLCEIKDDLLEQISDAKNREENLRKEICTLSEQTKSVCSLQEQCRSLVVAAEESKLALENMKESQNQSIVELQNQTTRADNLQRQLTDAETKVLSLEKDNAAFEEKLHNAKMESDEQNVTLQSLHKTHQAMCDEKDDLMKQISNLSKVITEREAAADIMTNMKNELEASNHLCAELKNSLESVQKVHASILEENSNLQDTLKDKSEKNASLEMSIKELSDKYNKETESHVSEMEIHFQKHKGLEEQIDSLRIQFDDKCLEALEATEKLEHVLSETSVLKQELVSCNERLKQVTNSQQVLANEMDGWKQAASSHSQELESLRADLAASRSNEKSKMCEIQTLKEKFQQVEIEHGKTSNALKEKVISMNKIKVQLEMLQMDLDDNEACMNSFNSQIEEMRANVSILEEKLGHSDAQKSAVQAELDSVKEELLVKDGEISQLTICVQEAQKQQHSSPLLASELGSLQTANEKLKVTLEEEICKHTNIEKMYNNVNEQKRKLDSEFKELQRESQESIDELKQENGSLQDVIKSLTEQSEMLRSSLELATQQSNKDDGKDEKLEEEQIELHRQLSLLQSDYSQLKDQYHGLLFKVTEQQSHIEQLKVENDLQMITNNERQSGSSSMVNDNLLANEEDVNPQLAQENESDVSHSDAIVELPFSDISVLPFEDDMAALDDSVGEKPSLLMETDCAVAPLLSDDIDSLPVEGQLHLNSEEAVGTLEEQSGTQLELLKVQHATGLQTLEQQMDSLENVMEAEQSVTKVDEQLKTKGSDKDELLSSPNAQCESNYPDTDLPPTNWTIESTSGMSSEKEQLIAELEENKEILRKRGQEMEQLCSQFEVLTSEMIIRKDLCTELESKVHEMELAKADSAKKIVSITQENQRLADQIVDLKDEIDSLKLQLQTSKCQLSDVMDMLEGFEVAKGGWDEKFLQVESELKRVRSEKSNLEKHILSMEADIDEMQQQKHEADEELEKSRKAIVSLEQQLSNTVAEGGQLKKELFLCAEERESENHTLLKLREKAELLETRETDTRELIKVLEEDIRTGKRHIETASNQIDVLQKEREQLLQQSQTLENAVAMLSGENKNLTTELDQLKNEDSASSRESDTMACKIQHLEDENLKLSQSLESSLMEKGEIASRLISTQKEVIQMREGIEKLKVRIESDERKKKHMSQLLKDAQRKTDALQDSIESFEREKEMSDQSLEDAVLQAETAKAELEDLEAEKQELSKKIEEMTMQLNNLRDEKGKLEEELTNKNKLIDQLQRSHQEVVEKLANVETAMRDAEVNQKKAVEDLLSKVRTVEGDLQLCRRELESTQLTEQDLVCQLGFLQSENQQLTQRLHESEKLQGELQSSNQTLLEDLEVKQQELSRDKDELHHQAAELQALACVAEQRDELQRERASLQSSAAEWEEKAQIQAAKTEVMQITITSLEASIKELENQLESSKLTSTEITEKLNALHESNINLQSQLGEEVNAAKERQNSLTAQLNKSQQQMETYKLSLETLASEKQELLKSVTDVQQSLALEMTEKEKKHNEVLKQMLQQHELELNAVKDTVSAVEEKAALYLSELTCLKSCKEETTTISKLQNKLEECEKAKSELTSEVSRLLKARDGALSKMNLWMKSYKQLEKEKQALQEENHQQAEQITALSASHTAGDGALTPEVEELKEALEEKAREADEAMNHYCTLMVKFHKLEEVNESLTNKLKQLSSKPGSDRRSSRKSQSSVAEKQEVENARPPEEVRGESPITGKRLRPGAEDTPCQAHKALQNVAKRLRAATATPKAGEPRLGQEEEQDDFRPEGLPELVRKGFADIPMGEASPYIMRRTTVQRCSPRLATAQPNPAPTKEPVSHCPKTPAEGSSQQKQALRDGPAGGAALVSLTNSPKARTPESPAPSTEERRSRRSLSTKKSPEQQEKRRQVTVSAKQEDQCQVQ